MVRTKRALLLGLVRHRLDSSSLSLLLCLQRQIVLVQPASSEQRISHAQTSSSSLESFFGAFSGFFFPPADNEGWGLNERDKPSRPDMAAGLHKVGESRDKQK